MSFQTYLDNIKAKTGKTADDFRVLAAKKRFVKHGEIIAWLKLSSLSFCCAADLAWSRSGPEWTTGFTACSRNR